MRKWGTFGPFVTEDSWPTVEQLEPFFLAPPGQEWSYDGGSDSWALNGDGMYETGHLPRIDQVNVHLIMIGHPEHGVYLQYDKWDGRTKSRSDFSVAGDPGRFREYVWSMHGTPLSVGLFISFATAWKGVKEFIESDGELPQTIEWVASDTLPSFAFPDPGKTRRPR
jgi:hypothetical protein